MRHDCGLRVVVRGWLVPCQMLLFRLPDCSSADLRLDVTCRWVWTVRVSGVFGVLSWLSIVRFGGSAVPRPTFRIVGVGMVSRKVLRAWVVPLGCKAGMHMSS